MKTLGKIHTDAFIVFSDFAFIRQINNGVNSLYVEDLNNDKNRAVFIFDNKTDELNLLSCSFSSVSNRLYEMFYLIEKNKKYMIMGVSGNVIR